MIKLLDAQDVTLDTFWQELFYSHELCRLSGEKPDESAIQACPLPRLKRTGHPPDRKIRDFAEIISAFLATPLPLIRQNLRFRRNFVKHFSIP